MARSTTELNLKVTADAKQAASGLRPLESSLQEIQTDAKSADAALDGLTKGTHAIRVDDSEVQAAEQEITRLRQEMRDQLRADVHADTRDAQRKIKALQSNIKTLNQEKVSVNAKVNVDGSGFQRISGMIASLRGQVAGGGGEGGGGGLLAGLSLARGGLAALGSEAAVAAGPLGIMAAALVATGKAAWNLGQMAADAETQVLRLDTLTKGMGKEAFGQIQDFAASTPFEVDEISNSFARLTAAGVSSEDAFTWLQDIGDVAAGSQVPIEQITAVFAQMASSGKASFENLQQLADAGIPVWTQLAKVMGLSVAQVQKMATEGKLGADAIDLVRESTSDVFSGAMEKQSKSFNGEMSTLNDNMKQIGQTVGTIFLPAMKDVLELTLNLLRPVKLAADTFAEWNTKIEAINGGSLLGTFSPVVELLDILNGGLDDSETAAAAAATSHQELADKVNAEATAASDAAEASQRQKDALQKLSDQADDTATRYEELKDSFTTVNDRMVNGLQPIYDYEGALDDLAASIKENGAKFAPGTEQGRNNFDKLVGLAEAASARVQSVLETQGAEAAQKVFQAQRQTMAQLLIDSGVKSKEAWQLVNQVMITPHQMKVEISEQSVAELQAKLAGLQEQKATIEAQLEIPVTSPAAQVAHDELERKLGKVNAKIYATTGDLGTEQAKLDALAKPGGKARNAPIKPVVDPVSAQTAHTTLYALTKPESKTITVNVVGPPGGIPVGGGGSGPRSAGTTQLLGASQLMATSAATTSSATGAGYGGRSRGGYSSGDGSTWVSRVGPKQTPVKVYLDGVAVADQLALQANRMYSSTSVRRSA